MKNSDLFSNTPLTPINAKNAHLQNSAKIYTIHYLSVIFLIRFMLKCYFFHKWLHAILTDNLCRYVAFMGQKLSDEAKWINRLTRGDFVRVVKHFQLIVIRGLIHDPQFTCA